MNYLAHLALADGSPDSIVGNFLGDFVKGRPEGRFPAPIVRGIRLHRAVDSFTDTHPVVRRAIGRLPAEHRRFAGIAIDLAFDHFLAARWRREAAPDFDDLRRHAYAVLAARESDLPEPLQRMLPSLIRHDWLGAYAELDGITVALARMGARLSRPNPLAELGDDIAAQYDNLRADFEAFWPEARTYACAENRRLARHLPDQEPRMNTNEHEWEQCDDRIRELR